MKKSAISFLIALLLVFSLAYAWDRSGTLADITIPALADTTYTVRVDTFYFHMDNYRIRRLIGEFSASLPDSVGSVYVYGYSSFDNVTWRFFYGDSLDSASFSGASTDSVTFLLPAYCDTVKYFAPHLKWEFITSNWNIAEDEAFYDSSGGYIHMNWSGFFED